MLALSTCDVFNADMNTETTIGERIKSARQKAGLSQEQLALAIGAAGQSTVGNYERGQNSPSVDVIQKIADVTGSNFTWLSTGMNVESAKSGRAAYDLSTEKYAYIRRLDVAGAAGNGTENGHEEVNGNHAYRRDWLDKQKLIAALCAVIQVDGESMEPTLNDGDVVLVNTAEKKIQSGKVFAIRTEDGVRLKRLHKQMDGRVKVTSDNPDKISYPDEWLNRDMKVDIIGLVVHRSGGV